MCHHLPQQSVCGSRQDDVHVQRVIYSGQSHCFDTRSTWFGVTTGIWPEKPALIILKVLFWGTQTHLEFFSKWRNKKLKVGRVVATKYFLWMITGKSEEFNTAQCTTSKLHLTNVEHGQEKHRSAPAINVQQCKWSIVLYTMPKYKNSNRRPLSTNACMFHSENKA